MRTPTDDEKRRFQRLPAAELKVAWRPRKGLFGRYQPTRGYDFTREGLCITEPPGTLATGDRIELRLQLAMETDDIIIERIVAEVVNERNQAGMSRLGLAFDFRANRLMRAEQTKAQLGRIEGILERSEKLRLRLQPLSMISGLADEINAV